MLRRLRENGPVVLVPLAWTFATAAHLGLVPGRPLLVAHVVIDVVLVVFAALSWDDMRTGILRAWKWVLVVGFGVTLVGTVALAWSLPRPLLSGTVVGWMVVPAVALWYTGERLPDAAGRVYTVGAALSLVGAALYAGTLLAEPSTPAATLPLVSALTLVNVGQTAGIVHAVYRF